MEKEIRSKSTNEKDSSVEKLKGFITKLKEKVEEIDLLNQKKSSELAEYEKTMKKVCTSNATQTHDGFYRKVKDL